MHLLILRCPWSPSAVVRCVVVPIPRVVVPTQAMSFHVGSGIPLPT